MRAKDVAAFIQGLDRHDFEAENILYIIGIYLESVDDDWHWLWRYSGARW